MEMTISSRVDHGLLPCFVGIYFEIHDGLNQSANLLGILCAAFTKERVFRSSGHNMYLKFHKNPPLNEEDFHINYTAKPMNITGLNSELLSSIPLRSLICTRPFCIGSPPPHLIATS